MFEGTKTNGTNRNGFTSKCLVTSFASIPPSCLRSEGTDVRSLAMLSRASTAALFTSCLFPGRFPFTSVLRCTAFKRMPDRIQVMWLGRGITFLSAFKNWLQCSSGHRPSPLGGAVSTYRQSTPGNHTTTPPGFTGLGTGGVCHQKELLYFFILFSLCHSGTPFFFFFSLSWSAPSGCLKAFCCFRPIVLCQGEHVELPLYAGG